MEKHPNRHHEGWRVSILDEIDPERVNLLARRALDELQKERTGSFPEGPAKRPQGEPPALPSLPNITREKAAILQLFPGSYESSTGLTAGAAKSRNFEVIHYAGHWQPFATTYDEQERRPSISLWGREQLIVLAGCRTGLASPSRGALRSWPPARLLTEGVPGVVASLWSVSDQATSQLMIRFYRELRAGKGAAEALRLAQVYLLRQGGSLAKSSAWGAFQVYGYGGI
jgi:CHAT domain-containing protein